MQNFNGRQISDQRTGPVRNSWFFKRDTEKFCVVVTANYIRTQEMWSMNCKINGELVDACLSDDPWQEAQAMISKAVMLDGDVTATVTKDTPPAIPAAGEDEEIPL